MKNSNLLTSIFSISILCFLQLFIFNNIIIFNGIFPIIYIIFIIFYNTQEGLKTTFLLYSFMLGLSLDLFLNTPGLNAFAAVFAAYNRKYIIRLIRKDYFTQSYSFSFSSLNMIEFLTYVLLVTFSHHLIIYLLEGFKISSIFNILLKVIYNTFLSSFFIFIYSFFKKD